MSHCRVLTCDREATKYFQTYPVCDPHNDKLVGGAEYRKQSSEQSVLGTSEPMLLMGQQLLDLNEYIVLEPPHDFGSHIDCPEGKQLPLHVRRRGDTETDITLVLPPEVLTRFGTIFSKHDPESRRGRVGPLRSAHDAFLHVVYDYRYLCLAGSGRRVCGPSADPNAQQTANTTLPGIGVPLLDSLLLHARALIEFYRETSRYVTDIRLARFSLAIDDAVMGQLETYSKPIEVHGLHLTDWRDTAYRVSDRDRARPNWDVEDLRLVELLLDALANAADRARQRKNSWERPFRLLHEASRSLFADPAFRWPRELGEKHDVDAYLTSQGL